jgi:hypothetical protein
MTCSCIKEAFDLFALGISNSESMVLLLQGILKEEPGVLLYESYEATEIEINETKLTESKHISIALVPNVSRWEPR